MNEDRRETIVACYATECRFNLPGGIEPTCNLKLVCIGKDGKCKYLEYLLNTKHQCTPISAKPGGEAPGVAPGIAGP